MFIKEMLQFKQVYFFYFKVIEEYIEEKKIKSASKKSQDLFNLTVLFLV